VQYLGRGSVTSLLLWAITVALVTVLAQSVFLPIVISRHVMYVKKYYSVYNYLLIGKKNGNIVVTGIKLQR